MVAEEKGLNLVFEIFGTHLGIWMICGSGLGMTIRNGALGGEDSLLVLAFRFSCLFSCSFRSLETRSIPPYICGLN